MRRRATLLLAVVLVTAACGSPDPNSIAGQARSGNRTGYVSGDGTVSLTSIKNRKAPLAVAGTTLDGEHWALSDERGKIVVLNVWGSWCGPCVKEAPELQRAWEKLRTETPGVVFMGLDFKEGPEAGRAFENAYGITYPSLAYDDGRPALGLNGLAPTVPTTLILDTQGRVAARILGATTASTLIGLVQDVALESPAP